MSTEQIGDIQVSEPSEPPLSYREMKAQIRQLSADRGISPDTADAFLAFHPGILEGGEKAAAVATAVGATVAIGIGTLFAAYPEIPQAIAMKFPGGVLDQRLFDGINFLHSIHNSHIDQMHWAYHVPDLGFDVALFSPLLGLGARVINSFGWRKDLPLYQAAVSKLLENGGFEANDPIKLEWRMAPSYTALLVGNGDYLADEFVLSKKPNETLLFAARKQESSPYWVKLDNNADRIDLEKAFKTGNFTNCGEIYLMPVRAEHMVLPPGDAMDMTPDQIEIMIKDIRALELTEGEGKMRRIVIVGDKTIESKTGTYDENGKIISGSETIVTLASIQEKYENVTVIDPTELVMEKVLQMAAGKKIRLRANAQSNALYGPRLRQRLHMSGYKGNKRKGEFLIGYNVTDQATIIDPKNSVAVVLTASARDKLLEDNYPPENILYVPRMVLDQMKTLSAQQ